MLYNSGPLFNPFLGKQDKRYAIEAYFQKEGDNKLYKGIYGFTY